LSRARFAFCSTTRTARPSSSLGEKRKTPQDSLVVGLHSGAVAPDVGAEAKVLPHGEVGERSAAFRHVCDSLARDRLRASAADPMPREDDLAVRLHGA
jgi:hypothetical protein